MTRLVGRWMKQRCIPLQAAGKRRRFARRYTAADIRLLASVDGAHEDLSGPGVRRILQREFAVFGKPEFRNLAAISASHIYNLRDSKTYASVRVHITHTQARQVSIGERLANRIQLTSDGLNLYIKAVDKAFAGDVDYAMLVKVYGIPNDGEKRYSPAQCLGCESHTVTGNPDPKHISTSYVERQNLTVRMTARRFTRLTNAFSKKIENHIASVALTYFAYNFIKIHRTLRTTPAMAAGVTDRLWEVSDLVAAWEAEERAEIAA